MAKPERIPRHSKEELNAVAVAAQGGDRDATERLFRMMRPYLVAILRRVNQEHYTREQREELDQAAAVGVLEALQRFDPEAGTKFSTWAHPWIKGEVSEWLARNTGSVPMPRAAWHYAARIEDAYRELHGQDSSPHDAHDGDLADLPIEVVRDGKPTLISVPYAAAIFRARQSAYPINPWDDHHAETTGGMARKTIRSASSPSAEQEFFGDEPTEPRRPGVTRNQERATLAFIDSLDALETEAWEQAAEDFISERSLPTDAETLVAQAALYHGRIP